MAKWSGAPAAFSWWAGEIARAEGMAFVDVTNIVADEYERLGQDKVGAFFPKDHTHTSIEGADLNAALVVSGLKSLPACPLVGYLLSQGQKVKSYAGGGDDQGVDAGGTTGGRSDARNSAYRPWLASATEAPTATTQRESGRRV